MDGPGEHYAKWNKPVRERQIPYDFTHMWNQMNKLNKQIRSRLIDGEQDDSLGVGLEDGGIEQTGKRTHRHGQQCSDCLGEDIRGLNGNGKKYIKKCHGTYPWRFINSKINSFILII